MNSDNPNTADIVEQLIQQAREIEGDSDNPLRVAAANRLYAKAAALKDHRKAQA